MTNTLALDEIVVSRATTNNVEAEAAKTDLDLLKPQEMKQHWPEVAKGMIKELHVWPKLKCFSTKPRREANIIIDAKWAIRCKWDMPTSSGGNANANSTPAKTMLARLTVRGFRDGGD